MKTLTPGLRVVFAIACLFVIIGGLRAAGSFLVPIILAFFLTALNMPFIQWQLKRGVPHFLTVILTVLVNLSLISVFVALTVNAIMDFLPEAPFYVDQIRANVEAWGTRIFETPILPDSDQLKEGKENFSEMLRQMTAQFTYELPSANQVVESVMSLMGTVFFVFIIMIFMMQESLLMKLRLDDVHKASGPDLNYLGQISKDIQRYLHIKTAVSLATGALAWLMTMAFGLEFPLLWGVLAFVLNYIPSIGSLIAAIPPCLLALWQLGMVPATLIAVGYISINMALGNVIEPMLLGRRFGISTLVVVLSALFWGWVWGPVGMFVAIPLTMLIKVILNNSEGLRWISVAMGKSSAEAIDHRWANPESSAYVAADEVETHH
ncbi:AI-2E family transporter [bacterium]|jgi:predicted PurR-regulated permease PerM|nr:AI-2E family transporter [Verrucomicrobiales bacterium]MDA7526337.1 AI-2E family transporter [Verrucomicrobiales bacterium]MDB2347762.1 AI-2E family transporter [Verrucomicrobiales bacterium]MDB4454338.1 AI-2E family transporter [bacterium]MDF1785560.1 AI-2E family transporter [Verrucomicrobiales bacterium]